jgi:hypothetical protein
MLARACLGALVLVGCGDDDAGTADAGGQQDAIGDPDARSLDARGPGRLVGAIAPLPEEATVRLVQVYAAGDPATPTGYGQKVEDGGCLEVPTLGFSGTWERRGAGAGADPVGAGGAGQGAEPGCAELAFSAGPVIAAGAHANFYGAGPGTWVAHEADHALPGEILYVEVYHAHVETETVVVDGFQNWIQECAVCVFVGTGCDDYAVPINEGIPMAPVACDELFMLDRGVVTFSERDGP